MILNMLYDDAIKLAGEIEGDIESGSRELVPVYIGEGDKPIFCNPLTHPELFQTLPQGDYLAVVKIKQYAERLNSLIEVVNSGK